MLEVLLDHKRVEEVSVNLLAQVLVEDYQAVIPLEVGVLSNQVPP